jgi:hypothetical protein
MFLKKFLIFSAKETWKIVLTIILTPVLTALLIEQSPLKTEAIAIFWSLIPTGKSTLPISAFLFLAGVLGILFSYKAKAVSYKRLELAIKEAENRKRGGFTSAEGFSPKPGNGDEDFQDFSP